MEKKYCSQCSQGLLQTMQFCPVCGSNSFSPQPVSGVTANKQPAYQATSLTPAMPIAAQVPQGGRQAILNRKAMTLPAALNSCMSKYFTLKGRAPRSEYWWFFGAYIVVISVLGALSSISNDFFILYLSATLGAVIPAFTVGVRRLHDVDRSGWWILISFIPLIGPIVFIVWACDRGTFGDNRFGPDPLADEQSSIVNAQIL